MKIELWFVGKTQEAYLDTGISIYEKRLKHYVSFEMYGFADIKQAGKLAPAILKVKEGEAILARLKSDDYLVLLDEGGVSFPSRGFASWMEQRMLSGSKRLIFLIGGAFGFSEAVYQRSNAQLSLSKMTFSHQMVRLFFVEQLYRAMTILRNEGYHND